MNYSPENMYIWDAWYMVKDNCLHMYHLQRKREKNNHNLDHAENCIGHAVSHDLINWEERDTCFAPSQDQNDDLQPYTGCALWHKNTGYFYYTMRGTSSNAKEQLIGLATSKTPDNWTRYDNNPIITPDKRWYATTENPVKGVLDCRDLIVIKAPEKKGWFGYYATRKPADNLLASSVIACVYSEDLINWQHLPPAFANSKYACVEVPDVFCLNGLWYMTCLTANIYGNRGIFSDPNVTMGTIYAVAEKPTGPFHELDDNVLIGAKFSSPISVRSFMFEQERYILYTDRERTGHLDSGDVTFGTITTPKLLQTDGEYLFAAYSPRLEQAVKRKCNIDWSIVKNGLKHPWGQIWQLQSAEWHFDKKIHASSPHGWSVAQLFMPLTSFILEVDLTLDNCIAAGFCIRMETGDNGAKKSGACVALDAKEQTVFFATIPQFDFSEKRSVKIEQNKSYHLRVVNRLEHIEVYIDNKLLLTFNRYKEIGGDIGLFVDSGKASFANLRLMELKNINRKK